MDPYNEGSQNNRICILISTHEPLISYIVQFTHPRGVRLLDLMFDRLSRLFQSTHPRGVRLFVVRFQPRRSSARAQSFGEAIGSVSHIIPRRRGNKRARKACMYLQVNNCLFMSKYIYYIEDHLNLCYGLIADISIILSFSL